MNYVIDKEPKSVFHFFEEISRIPRGSGNEKAIADYLENFAKSRGLFCYRNDANDIFVRKPASAGRENEPAILFQSHTDMVCEKNEGVKHDFEKDPIEMYVDGNFLRARGTTLGADDGVGVALMLAVLNGDCGETPEIEALFTTSEETGMDGVVAFDMSMIKARKLINLDSEDLDQIVVGCAGGVNSSIDFTGKLIKNAECGYKITLNGLAGGHSGSDIHLGRANANKLMGRILLSLGDRIKLVSINGGGKTNAIPRECSATVVSADENVVSDIRYVANAIAKEISADDKNFSVNVEKCNVSECFDSDFTKRVVGFLSTVENGVVEMSKKIKGFVEYSRNLGVIRTVGNKISFKLFDRSAIDAQLDYDELKNKALADAFGGEYIFQTRSGGWDYRENSSVREDWLNACKKVMPNLPMKVLTIHAGLECGYFIAKIPDMDIISVGPTLLDIHSPDEKLLIDTVEPFFKVLCEVLNQRK